MSYLTQYLTRKVVWNNCQQGSALYFNLCLQGLCWSGSLEIVIVNNKPDHHLPSPTYQSDLKLTENIEFSESSKFMQNLALKWWFNRLNLHLRPHELLGTLFVNASLMHERNINSILKFFLQDLNALRMKLKLKSCLQYRRNKQNNCSFEVWWSAIKTILVDKMPPVVVWRLTK